MSIVNIVCIVNTIGLVYKIDIVDIVHRVGINNKLHILDILFIIDLVYIATLLLEIILCILDALLNTDIVSKIARDKSSISNKIYRWSKYSTQSSSS